MCRVEGIPPPRERSEREGAGYPPLPRTQGWGTLCRGEINKQMDGPPAHETTSAKCYPRFIPHNDGRC